MHTNRGLAAALVVTVLAACGGGDTLPTSPGASPPTVGAPATQPFATGCPAIDVDRLLLDALPTGLETAATAQFTTIDRFYEVKISKAQDKALGLIGWLQQRYDNGQFVLGKTEAARLQLLQLKTGILCLVGLPYPTSIEEGTTTVGIVYPNVPTTIVRADRLAGTTVPANAVSEPTVVRITPIDTPLPTDLTQYPLFFKFETGTPTTFQQPVLVAICLQGNPALTAGLDLRLARGTGGGNVGDIEILPFVPDGPDLDFLDCAGFQDVLLSPVNIGHPSQTVIGSLGASLRQFARRVTPAMANLLLPEQLQAANVALLGCCRLGGQTGSFSPFGAVDINSARIEAVGPTSFSGAPGTTATPTVKLTNRTSGWGLRGETVKFLVTSGGGSVAPLTVQTAQSGDGQAQATWTLGAANGTLTATGLLGRERAAPPLAIAQVPIPAAYGNPVTFTSTVADPLGYGAGGWKHGVFTSEAAALAAAGNPATLPNTGSAPFGSENAGCTLNSAGIATQWAPNTWLTASRTFTIAAGSNAAYLYVAIDNDVRVWVNGADVTATAQRLVGSPLTLGSGFVIHEGCPNQDTFKFTATGLNGTVHTITIVGRDRGVSSYFDARAVGAVVPVID